MNTLFPTILNSTSESNSVSLHLDISSELAHFDGHFPEHAILPGVTQIFWAEHFSRQYLGTTIPDEAFFSHLEAVKFQQLIRPGEQVELTLEYKADKQKLYFQYRNDEQQFSSGRLVFADTPNKAMSDV
ncbi:3-hydroxyacyl-ACP dehydratase FabZ family protein [Pseudoteredinibacter isoporae]|uniref:3-hydroxyacyl-ACP dehydratase FabZ family protein n=1 Tax=Pseudoteredinibacter isoporae TaxID=570281 RepID=UPI003101BD6B